MIRYKCDMLKRCKYFILVHITSTGQKDLERTHFKYMRQILLRSQGGNTQNFSGKCVRLFVTLRCFYGVVIHRK